MLPAIGQFLLVLMVWVNVVFCSFNGNNTDWMSLLEFKKIISDPQQALMSWNDSTHFCNWEGILCSTKHPNRVTSLRLKNQGLVGQISPSLGNLTFLKALTLSANSFSGGIPPSLGQLRRLQYLNLSNNTLQGGIPSFANCSKLEVLWLKNNQLATQIPADLPYGLQKLALGGNYNLTGNIPASLSNITTLKALDFAYSNIEGNIPNEFTKLSDLQFLFMASNKLSGPFPKAIRNLSNLIGFSVAHNNLSGDVPSNIGNSLPKLQRLELERNLFHGHIPSTLTNASMMYLIDMSGNNFTGVVPSSIGKLSRLSWLNLQFNELEARNKQDWEFMDSLANCTELQMLSVAVNRLEGNVPNSLANLSSHLQQLYLTKNQLSGDFPSGIANFHNLIILALYGNQFTGAIPEWLGTLKSLQELRLDYNSFTGPIPSSLFNLSNLLALTLNSNQFDGQIPPSLGNLNMLQVLRVSNNNLKGTVPLEIFRIPTIIEINLSFNNLSTPLPVNIGNAKQLTYLYLSSNNISGYIPSGLGTCESLEEIKLDHNIFSGSIPTSLGNIRNIKLLNLSNNNLTESIPASLGNLPFLEKLDFSFNHLKGEVPTKGIFRNITALQIDGNPGLCGGAPELHLVTCSTTLLNSRMNQYSTFLKVVIPLASILSLVSATYVMLVWRGKQKRKSLSLPSFSGKFPKVSYNDLSRATEGFSSSNLIGKGRFSYVYQGKLFQDRTMVAIKVFILETRGVQKSFIAECNSLRNVRHRNLVPILTTCSSIDSTGNDFKALVYEFMPRGDLHTLLYTTQGDGNPSTLGRITLAERLNIVVDVADALEYLHYNNQGIIVHCDLKPSNILLDDNMTAHVGDFGLSSFSSTTTSYFGDSISTSSFLIKGTIGYVPPEYAAGGEVSCAGDVYSFGIILLEIILRKRPTDDMFKDGLDIAKFVEMYYPDRISQIIDPDLQEDQLDDLWQEASADTKEKTLPCLLSVLDIGLHCTKASPNERKDMREVAARLHTIKEAYLKGNRDSRKL